MHPVGGRDATFYVLNLSYRQVEQLKISPLQERCQLLLGVRKLSLYLLLSHFSSASYLISWGLHTHCHTTAKRFSVGSVILKISFLVSFLSLHITIWVLSQDSLLEFYELSLPTHQTCFSKPACGKKPSPSWNLCKFSGGPGSQIKVCGGIS